MTEQWIDRLNGTIDREDVRVGLIWMFKK